MEAFDVELETMQKLTNFTGQARHGWEKMTPAGFGMGRPHPQTGPLSQQQHPQQLRKQHGAAAMSPHNPPESLISLSFNVPFASNLTGPEREEILHASPNALHRWLHPVGTLDSTPTHRLPVHMRNVEQLRELCKGLGESTHGRLEATVTSSESKSMPNQRVPKKGLTTNVCVSGDSDIVYKMRARILNDTPIALVRPVKITSFFCSLILLEMRYSVDRFQVCNRSYER